MVKVYYPPPNRDIDPQYLIIPPGTILKRIFDPTSYGGTATSFRYNGPRGRFDHQSRVNGKPADDPHRGIIYAGYTLTCC
ncbi:MAG: RES family NAD+ phosphorylase, partial [Waterburya sp.]